MRRGCRPVVFVAPCFLTATWSRGRWHFLIGACSRLRKKNLSTRNHIRTTIRHFPLIVAFRPRNCVVIRKIQLFVAQIALSHVRTHTGEEVAPPHGCLYCGKAFKDRHAHAAHLRTHTGEKPFPCEWCGKRFSTKSNLTTHIQTHTAMPPGLRSLAAGGDAAHECEYCGVAFASADLLGAHGHESMSLCGLFAAYV